MDIEFKTWAQQESVPRPINFNDQEHEIIQLELSKLKRKGVIVRSTHSPEEFISNIFIRPKKDGSYRLILNLKQLNENVTKRHFKMQGLSHAINLMTQDCYMASIDWKDAYYSVPVDPEYQKYLKFYWNGQLWQFTCLPNGLTCGPRVFTKITKPIFSQLRKAGHLTANYIDDSFLMGDTLEDCRNNVQATMDLSLKCGFIVHPDKSVFEPSQQLTYLGFVLDSRRMTVSLGKDKADKLQEPCQSVLDKNSLSIRDVAELVGRMVGSFPGIEFGHLYYRILDNEKTRALGLTGEFDDPMSLSEDSLQDIQWWIANVHAAEKQISHGNPTITLQSDASTSGWGGGGTKVNRQEVTGLTRNLSTT